MSINGLRNPVSTAPPSPHVAFGAPEADTKRTPDPGMNGSHRTVLSERAPQQAGEAAASPRIVLPKLGAVRQEQAVGTVPDAAQAIAAKVLCEVDSGKLALLASHSAASLRAAAGTAARGLMALRKDLSPRQ